MQSGLRLQQGMAGDRIEFEAQRRGTAIRSLHPAIWKYGVGEISA
jgi:hypothetical protein